MYFRLNRNFIRHISSNRTADLCYWGPSKFQNRWQLRSLDENETLTRSKQTNKRCGKSNFPFKLLFPFGQQCLVWFASLFNYLKCREPDSVSSQCTLPSRPPEFFPPLEEHEKVSELSIRKKSACTRQQLIYFMYLYMLYRPCVLGASFVSHFLPSKDILRTKVWDIVGMLLGTKPEKRTKQQQQQQQQQGSSMLWGAALDVAPVPTPTPTATTTTATARTKIITTTTTAAAAAQREREREREQEREQERQIRMNNNKKNLKHNHKTKHQI